MSSIKFFTSRKLISAIIMTVITAVIGFLLETIVSPSANVIVNNDIRLPPVASKSSDNLPLLIQRAEVDYAHVRHAFWPWSADQRYVRIEAAIRNQGEKLSNCNVFYKTEGKFLPNAIFRDNGVFFQDIYYEKDSRNFSLGNGVNEKQFDHEYRIEKEIEIMKIIVKCDKEQSQWVDVKGFPLSK
ncbi:hypothetical protein [Jiella pacifica]|uniref:Uncharacterized protein n=1 Tax=Jiella pacifica TaxID=2696469 RepID=A0A6N9T873_9HYPH|nr:hypothetical protein [Jiella pacifica]NDW07421.1 hypothetical protein [Jiella pacifica]